MIESASELFHRKGLSATSLADIARHAEIPIGNVYYYFKAKEELALAAVEKRRDEYRAGFDLLADAVEDPRRRLIETAKYYDKIRDELTRHGCPVGKIIEGADAAQDNVARAAAQIFTDFVEWASAQFRLLGQEENARRYAISLLSGVQGAIVIAKAFNDPGIITAETERLVAWLETVPNRKIQIGKIALRKMDA